ncbi:MAG: hypothetical protein M3461_21645 [Pseudomonadota bacterium]|nr:hypothetical protein [Pseudomonadota bacterium]
MTESFILMALGIGIGYSIIVWQHRSRATTAAAIGPNPDMQSVAHAAASTKGSKIWSVLSSCVGTSAKSIDEQVRESGAEVVMFVNSAKELIVLDAETRVRVSPTSSLHHNGHHDAAIRVNELGEPILFDTITKKDMVRHEKTAGGFRDSTPLSPRIDDARIIYFWQYKGSHCTCIRRAGEHYVRCRRS